MSSKRKGLQRRIRYVLPFAVYMNCRNHRLALCLVHLLKSYSELESLDKLLLSLWKLFEYNSVKQAVFRKRTKSRQPKTAENTESLYNAMADAWGNISTC